MSKAKMKAATQLGMNQSTASNRLVKDILFKLIIQLGYTCYRCGKELTRDTFSIEHKEPWLDSEDPLKLFFDLNNVSFSHLKCNVDARRKPEKVCGTPAAYNAGCKCEKCLGDHALRQRRYYESKNRVKIYTKYYIVYMEHGFEEFVKRTAYQKSKQNLVQMFAKYVKEFIPQNGKQGGK